MNFSICKRFENDLAGFSERRTPYGVRIQEVVDASDETCASFNITPIDCTPYGYAKEGLTVAIGAGLRPGSFGFGLVRDIALLAYAADCAMAWF